MKKYSDPRIHPKNIDVSFNGQINKRITEMEIYITFHVDTTRKTCKWHAIWGTGNNFGMQLDHVNLLSELITYVTDKQ